MAATAKKKVKNAILFDDGNIRIEGVRGSFLHLDKPYAGTDEGAEPKYSGTFMLPKATHKEAKELIMEQINKLCAEKKWLRDGKRTIPADKLFIKDGDAEGQRPEYAGHWLISAREKKAPILRDKAKNNVDRADAADVFYSGCWVNVIINPWAQDNKYGKRINANLRVVQFVKDDEPFAEGRITDDDADDMLDSVDDEDGGSGGAPFDTDDL